MKAVVIQSYGTPDVLQVQDVSPPLPGLGQILLRVEAVSVNYADIVRRRNDPYPIPTPLPAILGGEAAGVVEALGAGVTSVKVGDVVFALLGHGGYAQYAVAEAAQVIRLPAGFDLDLACTLVVAGVTAYQTLKEAGQLQPGESVFIPGALGGVGSYAVQLARHFGAAMVIAGGSTAERRAALLRRGADHAIDSLDPTWPNQVKAVTGGREPTTFAPPVLLARNQSVVGYYVSAWFALRPKRSMEAFQALVELIQSGMINVAVANRLPLAGAAEAHLAMQERRATGKFILKPWLAK
jgi:NADPH2:quinone reductase